MIFGKAWRLPGSKLARLPTGTLGIFGSFVRSDIYDAKGACCTMISGFRRNDDIVGAGNFEIARMRENYKLDCELGEKVLIR